MRQPPSGKAVTNEREYPYIVELVFDNDILDVELSRRMLDFHRSRKIQARHGRRIVREGQFFFDGVFLIRTGPARLRNSSAVRLRNLFGGDALGLFEPARRAN
jgi:hypothetical protein